MREGLERSTNDTDIEDGHSMAVTPANSQNKASLREHLRRFNGYKTEDDLTQEQLDDIRSLVGRLESGERVPEPTSWDEYQIDTRGFTDAEALEFSMPKFIREVLYPASIGFFEENEGGEVLSDLENLILQKLSSDPDAFSRELCHFFTQSPELRSVNRKSLFLMWVEKYYSQILSWEQLVLDVEDYDGHLTQRAPEKFARIKMGTDTIARLLTELVKEEEIDGFSKMRISRLENKISNIDEKLRGISYETDVDDERPFEVAPGKLGAVVKGRLRVADLTPELKKEYEDWCDLYERYNSYSDSDAGEHAVSFSDLSIGLDLIHKQMVLLQYSDLKYDTEYNDPLLSDAAHLEDIFDFSELQSPEMKRIIQESFGIELNQCTLSEQFDILGTLKRYTSGKLKPIQAFTKKFDLNGFRSFLALNEDESFGDIIIQLGERLSQDVAERLFEKYTEIIDASEKAAQEITRLQTAHGNGTIDEKALHGIAKDIRSRANALLRSADRKKEEPDQLLADLEEVHASSIMQAELFKGLVRNGELKPEHLEMTPSREKGADISQHERKEMIRFFDRNYHPEAQEFKDTIIGSFKKALENSNTDFYILRDKEGHIVAFSRIDNNEEELYFGSFNVHNMNTQGTGVGSYMLEETLREAKKKAIKEGIPIKAHCDPNAFITQKYIEWGFVATNLVDLAGKQSFEIVYDPNQKFQTKKVSKEQCEAQANNKRSSALAHRFPLGDVPNWSLLGAGYVLTRYFTNSEGEKIVVFEYSPKHDKLYEEEAA